MGDSYCSPAFGRDFKGSLDMLFGVGIERRGSFVEEDNLWVFEEGSSDGNLGLLSAITYVHSKFYLPVASHRQTTSILARPL